MLNLIFMFMMFMIFGGILRFAIKAAWGVSKIVCSIVLLPIFLVCLLIMGLVKLALPILIVVGISSILIKGINDI